MKILIIISLILITFPGNAMAQTISLNLRGGTNDGKLVFKGKSLFNIITRRATISGRLNTGQTCTGISKVNITFSKGSGDLLCGKLSAKVDFTITSLRPVKGVGTAMLSDGRKGTVTLSE